MKYNRALVLVIFAFAVHAFGDEVDYVSLDFMVGVWEQRHTLYHVTYDDGVRELAADSGPLSTYAAPFFQGGFEVGMLDGLSFESTFRATMPPLSQADYWDGSWLVDVTFDARYRFKWGTYVGYNLWTQSESVKSKEYSASDFKAKGTLFLGQSFTWGEK